MPFLRWLYQVIGDIAQLGERLNGIQEVSGSTPLISTLIIFKGGIYEYDKY